MQLTAETPNQSLEPEVLIVFRDKEADNVSQRPFKRMVLLSYNAIEKMFRRDFSNTSLDIPKSKTACGVLNSSTVFVFLNKDVVGDEIASRWVNSTI